MTSFRAIVDALATADQLAAAPDAFPHITDVVEDSRRVSPGALFCAIEGSALDGHAFAADAVRRGAVALLVTRPLDEGVPQVVVRDSRRAAAVAARAWYADPAAGMRVVAVTGTNGKSTTVSVLRHLLNDDNSVGSIGTLGAIDGAGCTLSDGPVLTTPGVVELNHVLARLRAGGVATVVMEASSHGIAQGRLDGVRLAAAVYTNLSHDHLDYHRDFAEYRAAKLALARYLARDGVAIVNADDPAWADLPLDDSVRLVRYGRSAGVEVRATAETHTVQGSRYRLSFGDTEYEVELPLLAEFNVTNALAAAAAAWGLGGRPAAIAARLASAPQVPGRVERLVSGEFTVVRDYAHTPDALQRVIAAMREVTTGRVVVLFGAGGDRDRAKRPVMGRVAAAGADVVFLTSDNPRSEDPERILDDIERGMDGHAPIRLADRREAIRRAVECLEHGDCLILAGKGHEMYQIVGRERRPFDEPAMVAEALKARVS